MFKSWPHNGDYDNDRPSIFNGTVIKIMITRQTQQGDSIISSGI